MILIGIAVLLVALVCGYAARRSSARADVMESTETLPVAELRTLHQAAAEAAGSGHFRHRCEVTGTARAHKNGTLTSELQKLDCVWHKHKVTRRTRERYRDSNGHHRTRTQNRVVSEHSSSTAFFVQDDTGKMVIRPGNEDVAGAEKVLDRFDPHSRSRGPSINIGSLHVGLGGGDRTVGYKREEWIVRPGSRFFVNGEAADPDGTLAIGAPEDGGPFVLSAKSEKELLRDENNRVLGFGIGTGVAAVAGAALVVLGIVL